MERLLDIDETEHALALMRSLDNMRMERKGCDLIIKVGNEEMAVHRSVVRSQSDYFDAMLSHETLENESGVVEMKGVKFEPVKKCIDFFYTGRISSSNEDCEELLYTASLMQIKSVCDKIAPFLENSLDTKSFFDIRRIATKFTLASLRKVCDEFAFRNLDEIVKENEFNELEMEEVAFLIKGKKDHGLHAEDSKLAIIMQWIKFDPENRKERVVELSKVLELGRITQGTIKYILENESLLYSSSEFLRTLLKAGLQQANVKARPFQITFKPQANCIMLFDISSKRLRGYFPETKSLVQLQPLHAEMAGEAKYVAAIIDAALYVLMENRKVYLMNLSEKDSPWIPRRTMLKRHGAFLQAVVHRGLIYVTGDGSMEKYFPSENKWEEIHHGGQPSNECALATHGMSIYTIGGRGNGVVKDVNQWRVESSTWSAVTPMPNESTASAACLFDGKIYVAGGWSDRIGPISDVTCYSPHTGTWNNLAAMNNRRCAFGLCVADGRLFAVGHFKDSLPIEEYDIKSDSWRDVFQKPDMKIMARATIATCLVE